MRKAFALLPFLALAACGGGAGPQTVGSIPVPASSAGNGSGSSDNNAGAAGMGGSGTGVTSGTSPSTSSATSAGFLSSNPARTYAALGGGSTLNRQTDGVLYQGNSSTVRSPLGEVSYDPRDGVFTLKITDTKTGMNTDIRFQDPAHRTDFNGTVTPQPLVPRFNGFNYLEVLGSSADDISTFFYQRPGAATTHVTLAGYVRNNIPADPNGVQTFERAAFVFGDQTTLSQLPTTGSASYRGGFIASMVANTGIDQGSTMRTSHQWLAGNSAIGVDFGAQTFTFAVDGRVDSTLLSNVAFPTGTTFFANGSGKLDLLRTGGFTGAFQTACFAAACGTTGSIAVNFAGVSPGSSTAGASSIDGAFYGPAGVNVGGSFRIIGGVPDQRVDITGAFTGAKVGN